MSNVYEFPVKCGSCKSLIDDGMIYFDHPRLGFVCERCPEFGDGQISAVEVEDGE